MADIVMKNISKQYGGRQILDRFSMVVTQGERVAVMGPSGQGKTTWSRLLLGLEKPDTGEILGVENTKFCPVFQEDRLCEQMTAVQNVELVLPKGSVATVREALRAVGLTGEDINKPAEELSGGQKRRVALVRAVEAAGDVLLLDEAFKGLDDGTRRQAYDYVTQNLRGRTLFVITHDAEEAKILCRRNILLSHSV